VPWFSLQISNSWFYGIPSHPLWIDGGFVIEYKNIASLPINHWNTHLARILKFRFLIPLRTLKQHPEWRIFPMRKAMLFLTVFALAGSLWAADPIIGTWKLNTAKSKDPGKKLTKKEKTATVRDVNVDQIEFIENGIKTDGTKYSTKDVFPKQGGSAIGDKTGSNVIGIYRPG
jgi:hypothetical protein